MPHSIAELARLTGLRAAGDATLEIDRPAEPGAAGPRDLALAMSPRYAAALEASPARAAVLWEGADPAALGLEAALFAPRARLALAGLTAAFAPPTDLAPGIDPRAAVDPSAEIGPDARIGPFAVVGAGARIGAGTVIAPHASVGADCVLGEAALLHPGVRIAGRARIGARFIAQANAVVGSDGFSFVTPERGAVESAKADSAVAEETRNTAYRRIHSLGGVEIGDDVEIGAGSCIDQGTIAPTRIGSGTKIDNLVQIGHNARIGETCLICGHVGLAGSVRVGDRAVLGGKVGVGDNLAIGADAVLAGGTLVGADVPAGSVMIGVPAMPKDQFRSQMRALRRLPRLQREIAAIREKLGL